MGLFEQRISAEQVAAGRAKIAGGGSLRAAAAEIPCAPSTLSVRIKKAEAAEDEARRRTGLPAREPAEAVSCLDKRLARGLGPALVGVVNVPA